jgi:hypothetical protein
MILSSSGGVEGDRALLVRTTAIHLRFHHPKGGELTQTVYAHMNKIKI